MNNDTEFSRLLELNNAEFDREVLMICVRRRDREIMRQHEVIEKMSDKVQDRDDRIAVLDHLLKQASDNLDASEKDLLEAQATIARLQRDFGVPA
jgi:chromosome segregation ATPase